MNKNKKVLLKIRNLKQYFPLKRNKNLFVKANDGISLDIYEGETFGLVGESGCGKSTFGRVLLQLYHQTAGDSIYYGKDLYEIAPSYIKDTLNKIQKEAASIPQLIKSTSDLTADNENAKKLLYMAQIAGGLLLNTNLSESLNKLEKLYESAKSRNDASVEVKNLQLKQRESKDKSADSAAKIKETERIVATKTAELDAVKAEINKLVAEVEKNPSVNKEKFKMLEAERDGGIDLARLKYNEMRRLRMDMQLIFQDPYSSLNPRMTVGQIVGEGLKAHGFFSTESEEYTNYVSKVMVECGLQPYMIHRYPHQFSGGQRQRIGIARSLAVRPKFVVCDEAVSALDVSIQSQILNLLEDLKEKENLTYLFISHDLSVVKYISDRIGVMYLGNLVELAETEEMFANPLHPYTEALLLAIPTTESESKKESFILEGDIPSPINPPKGCKFHTRCRYAQDICKQDVPEFKELRPGHFVACHVRAGNVNPGNPKQGE